MKADVKLGSDAAIVAFVDAGDGSGARTRAGDAGALRERAPAGGAFVIEGGDPVAGFHLYVNEEVPPGIGEDGAAGGPFLLRVPSGRLSAVALAGGSPQAGEPPETHAFEVPPGDYAVSVFESAVQDASAVRQQQPALRDDPDWRIYERVNHVAAFGCLAIAAGMLFVLIPATRREYWFLLPLFLLPTCAFSFLRRLPAYVRVQERVKRQEASLPRVVVSMRRTGTTEGLEGGCYRRR